jgi:hypothetical protein
MKSTKKKAVKSPALKKAKLPSLPKLLAQKIYKTGQTRGADDDVIYQNRVVRSSTVLIHYDIWDKVNQPPDGSGIFENGYIALITPKAFFECANINAELKTKGLAIGVNALVFYQLRTDWEKYPPSKRRWVPAVQRFSPLGGQYVARVAGTTAQKTGGRINRGFTTTGMKGAGIRLFEYASKETIEACRLQLEAIFWLCRDSSIVATEFGMKTAEVESRRAWCFQKAEESSLLDFEVLRKKRLVNDDNDTICPLCLQLLSGNGFFSRLMQAEGREVHDLTVTEVNLFHINELRYGSYNHLSYNLGWGHHHCNTVVKDAGIGPTLDWMSGIIDRNVQAGLYKPKSNVISDPITGI